MSRLFNIAGHQSSGLIRVTGRKKKLRVAKVPWHTGHDYELAKIPVEFLLISDTHRQWAVNQRPLPSNVSLIASSDVGSADLLIVHLDQWIFQELDKLVLFEKLFRLDMPKIVLNHGCNMVDGCSSKEMQDLLGDALVICNSSTAQALWDLPNSRYIHHGMTPEEWPQSNYGRQNIVVTQSPSGLHQAYRNNEAAFAFEKLSGIEIDWIGRNHTFDSFAKYKAFLSRSCIYFNPSYASPNPRARTEAMLCGLVPVTTNSHGEDRYIQNGVNGFCSNDMQELYENLVYLHQNPDVARTMGMAARKTAHEYFHIDRFVGEWEALLAEKLGQG